MGPKIPRPNKSYPYEYLRGGSSDPFKPQMVTFEISTFNADYIDHVDLEYYFSDKYSGSEISRTDSQSFSSGDYSMLYWSTGLDSTEPWYGNDKEHSSHTFTGVESLEVGKYGAQGNVKYNGKVYYSPKGDGYWFTYHFKATPYLKDGTSCPSVDWYASYRFVTKEGHNNDEYKANTEGKYNDSLVYLYKTSTLS